MLPWLCRAAFLLHHRKLAYQTVMSVSCTSAAVDKSNANSGKKSRKKEYFQKVEHLTCHKILELVYNLILMGTFEIRYNILRDIRGCKM